jgi:hypothetical protein
MNRRHETIKCVLFTYINIKKEWKMKIIHKRADERREKRESKVSVPVKACARHYGNSFTKTFVYFSPHVLSFTICYYPSLKNFSHISCRCMCEKQKSRIPLFYLREKKLPHNSVCIGTSKLSVVELVNTRSSSIFLHFFTDIFYFQF